MVSVFAMVEWLFWAAIFVLALWLFVRYPAGGSRMVLAVGCWLLLLGLTMGLQELRNEVWLPKYAGSDLSAEEVMALSNSAPEVFGSWLLFGWIPIAVAWILAKWRVSRTRKSEGT